MAFPAILAAAIAGAGAIAGGVSNLVSAADANKTNREISEDTNATNMQINREQLAAQRAMYYTQARENRFLVDQAYERELENRSYNSPQNQKELYLRAGINPLLAGQFGSVGGSHSMNVPSGQVPSSSTPNAIPAQSGLPVQPLNFDGFGVAASKAMDLVSMQQSEERLNSDIAAQKQRVDNETAETLSRIQSSKTNDVYNRWLSRKLAQDWAFNNDHYYEKSRNLKLVNDKLDADVAYTKSETEAQNFANSVAPELHSLEKERLSQEIAQAQAMVAEVYARKDLTDKEKDLVVKKIAEQAIRNSNLPKSLHNDNAIQVATYNQIKKAGQKLDQETRNLEWIEKDLRKGHRSHPGNDRSLEDIIEVELKRNPLKRK